MSQRFIRWAAGVTLVVFASTAFSQSPPDPLEMRDFIEISDAQLSLIQNTFVASPIPGIVRTVAVRPGDKVAWGDLLIQLDDGEAEHELVAATAAYQAARIASENEVDAQYARRTLDVRQRELARSLDANRRYQGAIPDTEIARLELVVQQSTLAIEQAMHEQEVAAAKVAEKRALTSIAELRLQQHAISAPVGGFVTEVDIEVGEWVEGGKPVVRVVSLDPIRVECFLDRHQFQEDLVGRAVTFLGADGGERPLRLRGKVTFVSPELHPVTGQTRLWATLGNADLRALAGMRGRLQIRTD